MRTTALVIMVTILSGGVSDVLAAQSPAPVEAAAWRDVANAIPLGTRVKAQTMEGRRISGTLMQVTDAAVLVKRNTRLPEPAVSIAFADLSRLERDHGNGGINIAKAVAIAVGAGAGVVFTIFMIALQLD